MKSLLAGWARLVYSALPGAHATLSWESARVTGVRQRAVAQTLVGTDGVHGQAQSGPCGRGFEAARMPPESARQDGVLSRSLMLGGGREAGPQPV